MIKRDAPFSYLSAFLCRCPACGKGRLYKGLLVVTETCEHCGFSLREHDAGDGPAYIAIFLVGTIAVVGALFLEILYQPPFWVHAVLWGGFTVVASIGVLRVTKSLLIALQLRHRLGEFEGEEPK